VAFEPGGLKPPTSETTIAVLIGASTYPRRPDWSNPVLRASAHAFRDYLRSAAGFGLVPDQVLDLFDDDTHPTGQLLRIGDFLASNARTSRDLIVYYVGHGGFHHDDYYLAVQCTQHDREFITTIESRKLAQIIRREFSRKRVYVILDSCFSASAVNDWQGSEIDAAVRQIAKPLPRQGTAFLAAASKYDVTRAPRAERYTVFTGAMLEALTQGIDCPQPRISLYELYEEVSDLLRRREAEAEVESRPELHSPSQTEGDISHLRLFPNAAYGHAARLDPRVASIAPSPPDDSRRMTTAGMSTTMNRSGRPQPARRRVWRRVAIAALAVTGLGAAGYGIRAMARADYRALAVDDAVRGMNKPIDAVPRNPRVASGAAAFSSDQAGNAARSSSEPTIPEQWYTVGEREYNLGNYEKAVGAFKQGYEHETDDDKRSAYLYNIAQSYRRMKDCSRELYYYRRFLALKDGDPTMTPVAPNVRQYIEDWIKEAEDCVQRDGLFVPKVPEGIGTP
jgi:hypothetical protein